MGHLYHGIIASLVTYVLCKDTDKEAARRHLTVSLAATVAFVLGLFILSQWVSFMLFSYAW